MKSQASSTSLNAVVFFILFNCSLLLNLGVPSSAVYLPCFIILFVILATRKKIELKPFVPVFTCLLILQIIDKLNDVFGGGDVGQLFPIIYTACFIPFLIINRNKPTIVDDIRRPLLFAILFLFLYAFLRNVPLRELDRDLSIMVLFRYFLFVFSFKNKTIKVVVGVLVFYLLWELLEARTASLSMVVFVAIYWLKIQKLIFQRFILLGAILSAIGLTAFGVYYEYFSLGAVSELYTGRGVMWGEVVLRFVDNNSLFNDLFGFPSTGGQLESDFGDFYIKGRGAHLGEILTRGNFHNTFVYTLYNTGIIGLLLLFISVFKVIKVTAFDYRNFAVLCSMMVVMVFQGRSVVGIYASSIIFQIVLFVPLINSKRNEYIKEHK